MFVADPNLDVLLRGFILAVLGLAFVVITVRIVGLRSFSKMTNFDFVTTIAVGSLLAGAARSTLWTDFAQAIVAVVSLMTAQWGLARLRRKSNRVERWLTHEPQLLMKHGEFSEEAMDAARVSRSDVVAKLRESNALKLDRVHAVVLETTGDVSVLHGEDGPDSELLDGVR